MCGLFIVGKSATKKSVSQISENIVIINVICFIPILNTTVYLSSFSIFQRVTFHYDVREDVYDLCRAQRNAADI